MRKSDLPRRLLVGSGDGKEGGKGREGKGREGKGREGRKEGRKEVSMYKKALISFGLHFDALAAICRGLNG